MITTIIIIMTTTIIATTKSSSPLLGKREGRGGGGGGNPICNQMVFDIGLESGSNPASVPIHLTNQMFQSNATLLVEFTQATGQVRVVFFSIENIEM